MLIQPDNERIHSVMGLKKTSVVPDPKASVNAKQVATPERIAEIQGKEYCSLSDSVRSAIMAKKIDPASIQR